LRPGLVFAAPEIGWWWNPNESGRGFFVESDGGITYIAGYFYEEDGRARWLVAGDANNDPYNYSGRLYEFRNGQTLFGNYVVPTGPTDVGPISLNFGDDTHGTITWPGGVIPIEREYFGAGTPDFQPFSGWWWNPDESGRGYSLEVQGGNLFIAAFMYDDNGDPVWYISAGPMSSPTTYTGSWLQFANGQTLTGSYQPPTGPTVVGTLSVEFTAQDEATFTFTDAATGTAKAVALKSHGPRIFRVGPQFPKCKPSRTTFPDRYDGNFTEIVTLHDTTNPFLDVIETVTITGALRFEIPELAPPLPPASPFGKDACGKPIQAQDYEVTGGTISVTYDYKSTPLSPGPPSCHQYTTSPKVFNIPADLDLRTYASLWVSSYSKYQLTLNIPAPNLLFYVSGECTAAGVNFPLDPELIDTADVIMGTNSGADVYGFHGGGTSSTGTLTRTFHWDFAAVKP
jgi:hypothetical protein